jgi:hypothetical protein
MQYLIALVELDASLLSLSLSLSCFHAKISTAALSGFSLPSLYRYFNNFLGHHQLPPAGKYGSMGQHMMSMARIMLVLCPFLTFKVRLRNKIFEDY